MNEKILVLNEIYNLSEIAPQFTVSREVLLEKINFGRNRVLEIIYELLDEGLINLSHRSRIYITEKGYRAIKKQRIKEKHKSLSL